MKVITVPTEETFFYHLLTTGIDQITVFPVRAVGKAAAALADIAPHRCSRNLF